MDTEYLINEIYNKTIDVVLNNTKSKNKQILQKGYKQYLINNYGYIDLNEAPYNNRPINELIDTYSKLEITGWKDTLEDEKISHFIPDEAYDEIYKISSTAYNYAEQRVIEQDSNYKSKITMEEVNKIIEKLGSLQEKLQDFNKERAKTLISETIMELLYASNQTDDMSLRLAREYNHIRNINNTIKK